MRGLACILALHEPIEKHNPVLLTLARDRNTAKPHPSHLTDLTTSSPLFVLHFRGAFIRYMGVLAVPASVMSGAAVASMASQWFDAAANASTSSSSSSGGGSSAGATAPSTDAAAIAKAAKREAKDKGGLAGGRPHPLAPHVAAACAMMCVAAYSRHAWWACTEGYATPAVLVTARAADGTTVVYDDFREAYAWVRDNTPANATVLAWSDHGPQIAALARRAVIADDHEWNSTHLGMAL
jgi:hypothetical protein